MKIIVTTNTNTLVEGTLCAFNKYFVTLDVEQLPAYKASAIIIEGGEITQYSKYVHVKINADMIQDWKMKD